MPAIVFDEDRRMIEAGAFRLVFSWMGDRWMHSLEHRERGDSPHRVLAISVEAKAGLDEPSTMVSPAYQDLQFQEHGQSTQALLVGQSGPHHFSAVFDVVEHIDEAPAGWTHRDHPSRVEIGIDVADRCRGPVEAIAATYSVDARSDCLAHASPSVAAWDLGPDRLIFKAIEPASVCLAEAGRRATQVQAFLRSDPSSATRRLFYQWSWMPDLRR